MEVHTGAIVERVVRRSGVSITELARRTHVNRRSVYNWFNQKRLKLDIICKIGYVLGHDFSVEFPNLFPKDEFTQMKKLVETRDEVENAESVYFWMNKYIALLEKYNELLLKSAKTTSVIENDEELDEAQVYSSLSKMPAFNTL